MHSENITLWPGPPVSRAALHPDSVQGHILLCTVVEGGCGMATAACIRGRETRDRSH